MQLTSVTGNSARRSEEVRDAGHHLRRIRVRAVGEVLGIKEPRSVRPVGGSVEVRMLAERVFVGGAHEVALQIGFLAFCHVPLVFPVVVCSREIEVASCNLDLGVDACNVPVEPSTGNACLIVGAQVRSSDELNG